MGVVLDIHFLEMLTRFSKLTVTFIYSGMEHNTYGKETMTYMDFLTSLFSIIVIDLVLGGDNAIVIGLAARNLPKEQQKRAILWGTVGAVGIRLVATFVVVWLLKIPGLLLAGGLLLIRIAYKLLVQQKGSKELPVRQTFGGAIWTIVVADAVMGIDNVLAIAGAAHGNYLLVVIGLLISVPIVVWGSTIILKFIERYPAIIYFGSGVLAFTAVRMIVDEPLIKIYFERNPMLQWILGVLVIGGVLLVGKMKNQRVAKSIIR